MFGVRGCQCPGYEGVNIRGTRVSVSGVRGYECLRYEGVSVRCPGYEVIIVRGVKVLLKVSVSGVRGC